MEYYHHYNTLFLTGGFWKTRRYRVYWGEYTHLPTVDPIKPNRTSSRLQAAVGSWEGPGTISRFQEVSFPLALQVGVSLLGGSSQDGRIRG